jgi:hypothetical protein
MTCFAPARSAGSRPGRRRLLWLGALFALAPLAVASEAQAGSYLNRAAMLVAQGSRECEFLRARINDKDLADLVHAVALARLNSASRMNVPKEVVLAHPHLLLTLENYERAADAATDGHAEKFLVYQIHAREEEAILRGVLKQLGWALPDY